MTDQRMPPPPAGLPARVSESLEAVWTRYSGKAPGNVETDICRNVVTCTLRGGVIEFSGDAPDAAAGQVPGQQLRRSNGCGDGGLHARGVRPREGARRANERNRLDQLEEDHLGRIRAARAQLGDAGVAARALRV